MGVNCSICGRTLDQENNPLSDDCGGDCWECIGEIEADMHKYRGQILTSGIKSPLAQSNFI